MDYDKLPETIIIFICLFDEFDRGRSIYTFKEICEEDTTLPLQDETRIIFLNSLGDLTTIAPELRAFLMYLNDPVIAETTDIPLISSLQNEVDDVKKRSEAKKEYMKLQLLLKEQHSDGYKAGHAEGLAEGQSLFCKMLYNNGMSAEDSAKNAGLALDQVLSLLGDDSSAS